METEALRHTLESAQLIDQYTAKGVMFLMLLFVSTICYFLMKRIFLESDNYQKKHLESSKNIETTLTKLADSLGQSLEFLKEDIKEQKEHNSVLRQQIEGHRADIAKEMRDLEAKFFKIVRSKFKDFDE